MKNTFKKVSISKGNAKMGAIPSVSLPPCVTCNPDAPCFRQCYAVKVARLYKSARDSYARNLEILKEDANAYWLQVKAAAIVSRFFRYHVSGDIPNPEYFAQMVKLAEELPGTTFLAFTKQYKIVNDFTNAGGVIPSNLIIIFSNWGAWKCDNPHSLPVCEVIFKGDSVPEEWKICGGNCTECACRGVGCWQLKKGDILGIFKH
jgi:hypothetical protein